MPVGDASPPIDDPLIGRVLSERYRILRKIGEGETSSVFLAAHIASREVCARVQFEPAAGSLRVELLLFPRLFIPNAYVVVRSKKRSAFLPTYVTGDYVIGRGQYCSTCLP